MLPSFIRVAIPYGTICKDVGSLSRKWTAAEMVDELNVCRCQDAPQSFAEAGTAVIRQGVQSSSLLASYINAYANEAI